MKIIFLCGIFAKENEKEIVQNSKKGIEYSANLFQKKLISGFKKNGIDICVISAPFIGAYPISYKKINFTGFQHRQNKYEYVNFNNIWGIRNLSRAHSLKKAIKKQVSIASDDIIIVVYSAHTPFLEAAVYAKSINSKIKICLIVPDLPQYMNLNIDKGKVYDFFKKYDIKRFSVLTSQVDSFVFLTEQMKGFFKVQSRPYLIKEGIIFSETIKKFYRLEKDKPKKIYRYVVYAGKISQKFGIKNLVDAFQLIKEDQYRLVLCGKGDALDYVNEKSKQDHRIIPLGQIYFDEAQKWIDEADVLVNPRQNNAEYTKYSFPSKNLDYLLSGNPVVAYLLDGMPKIYEDFLYVPRDESIYELSRAIVSACEDNKSNYHHKKFLDYVVRICDQTICNEIIKLN